MINYDLNKIRAVIFDIDGVLSSETITLSEEGVPLRTVNIKDGYAIQLAMKLGLRIAIMTGANVSSIRRRYEGLGVEDIYTGCAIKIETYETFLKKYGLTRRLCTWAMIFLTWRSCVAWVVLFVRRMLVLRLRKQVSM